MKSKRRFREKQPNISIASTHKESRIHDFLKGWGTICKDGSILWDHYRPPTKRELDRCRKNWKKLPDKLLIPIVNVLLPQLSARDIIDVQPMMTDS